MRAYLKRSPAGHGGDFFKDQGEGDDKIVIDYHAFCTAIYPQTWLLPNSPRYNTLMLFLWCMEWSLSLFLFDFMYDTFAVALPMYSLYLYSLDLINMCFRRQSYKSARPFSED